LQPVAAVFAVVLFACFVILFGIFWVGWLSRVRTKSCPMAFGFPCGRTAEFRAGGQVISVWG
jgi:hypothetical protein